MMTGARISRMQASSYALQGLALGLLLVFIAGINFEVPVIGVSAIFIPAGAIYLWPYRADYGLSVVCALLIGLFQDLALGGPLGMFALSYAVLYAMTNPAQQMMPKTKTANIAIFALWVAALIGFTSLLSLISSSRVPNLLLLATSGVLSVIMFCGLILARDYLFALTFRLDPRRSR